MGTITRTFKRETTEQLLTLGQDLQKVLVPWSEKNGYKVSISVDSNSEEPTLKITVTNSEQLKLMMAKREYSENN